MPYLKLHWDGDTPRHPACDDIYFSNRGDGGETRYVFIDGNDLAARFAALEPKGGFTLLETGFGTGLNFVTTLQVFLEQAPPGASLDYLAIEREPVHPDDIRRVAASRAGFAALFDELLAHYPPPVPGVHRLALCDGRVRLTLLLGEAAEQLASLDDGSAIDAWFLDGFAPAVNESMWNEAVFRQLARLSHAGSTLATYTVAGGVRRGLEAAGFEIERLEGFAGKRDMIRARLAASVTRAEPRPWLAPPVAPAASDSIVIVGAGIAGLSAAWHLVRRGYRVCLLERSGELATGASGNPAGLVTPRFSVNDDVDNRFHAQAALYAWRLYAHLQQHSDARFWFGTGVECSRARDRVAALRDHDLYSQFTADSEREPVDADSAWFRYPLAGWIRPRALCERLAQACGDALIVVQAEVAAVQQQEDGRYLLLDGAGQQLCDANIVVFANAAGCSAISGLPALPLTWNLGQLTSLRIRGEAAASPLAAGAYSTPVFEGRLVTGASYRHDVEDRSLRREEHAANIAGLLELQPGLDIDTASVEGRVAARANCPDRVPMVGAVPDEAFFRQQYADLCHGRPASGYARARYLPGLYLDIAHGSRGFTTAPLCGEIIASMIDGTAPPVPRQLLDHLNPARFIVRDLKRNAKGTI